MSSPSVLILDEPTKDLPATDAPSIMTTDFFCCGCHGDNHESSARGSSQASMSKCPSTSPKGLMSCYCHHFFGADYLRGPGQSNKTTQIIPRGEKSTFFVRMKEKSDRVEKFTGLFRIKNCSSLMWIGQLLFRFSRHVGLLLDLHPFRKNPLIL